MKSFGRDLETDKAPETVLREALTALSAPLGGWGYALSTQSDQALTFVRSYRPWFIWVLVVILFPLGLLGLLYKETATITVVMESREGGGTRVTVSGQGEAAVRRAFERMDLDEQGVRVG